MAIADALRTLGHDTTISSTQDLPRAARGRLSLVAFPLLVAWRAFRERGRWDVVDFASYDGWLLTFLPRRLRPTVLAFHSHGLENVVHDRLFVRAEAGPQERSWKYPYYRGSVLLWKVARAARRADVAFFLNRDERAFAVDRLGVEADRAVVTPNGLTETMLTAATRPPPPPAAGSPLNVAFVGTYLERKGIKQLMPALATYLRRHTAARVLLLGTGVQRDRILQDLPPEVHPRVTVTPRFDRSALPDLLSDSHVLVLPSLFEGFSVAGLEAMACGLVPILTRGHGFEEYTTDGVNGLLIDRGSDAQIVAALERLAADRAGWLRMREEALRTVQAFTWTRVAEERLAGYGRAMAMRAAGGIGRAPVATAQSRN